MSEVLAVLRYTLLEQTRRLVLIALVAVAVLLVIAIGLAPLVVPGAPTGEDRNYFIINSASSVIGLFTFICAIAIGMTLIYHDLDGGGVVTIFAKPISRLSYSVGKIASAVLMLGLIVGALAITLFIALRINGGGHEVSVAGFLGAELANVLLFGVLVMALTVVVNNIVAAIVGFVFYQVVGAVGLLHTLVQTKVIASSFWDPVINFVYWVVPHRLASDLPREIMRTQLARHPLQAGPRGRVVFDPLSTIPYGSSWPDILYWAAYLLVLCAILYWLVRRRQV